MESEIFRSRTSEKNLGGTPIIREVKSEILWLMGHMHDGSGSGREGWWGLQAPFLASFFAPTDPGGPRRYCQRAQVVSTKVS